MSPDSLDLRARDSLTEAPSVELPASPKPRLALPPPPAMPSRPPRVPAPPLAARPTGQPKKSVAVQPKPAVAQQPAPLADQRSFAVTDRLSLRPTGTAVKPGAKPRGARALVPPPIPKHDDVEALDELDFIDLSGEPTPPPVAPLPPLAVPIASPSVGQAAIPETASPTTPVAAPVAVAPMPAASVSATPAPAAPLPPTAHPETVASAASVAAQEQKPVPQHGSRKKAFAVAAALILCAAVGGVAFVSKAMRAGSGSSPRRQDALGLAAAAKPAPTIELEAAATPSTPATHEEPLMPKATPQEKREEEPQTKAEDLGTDAHAKAAQPDTAPLVTANAGGAPRNKKARAVSTQHRHRTADKPPVSAADTASSEAAEKRPADTRGDMPPRLMPGQ